MELNNRTILFIDLDSTLLGQGGSLFHTKSGRLSLGSARFLFFLKKIGVKLVFVSSRNRNQLIELSRIVGGADFIAEMGKCIGLNSGQEIIEVIELNESENPKRIYEKGKLDEVFKEFLGFLELHTPWYVNSEFTLMLRGCLYYKKTLIAKEFNERLAKTEFGFLRLCENGATTRQESLKCRKKRIYHLINKKQSKLIGAKEYLKKLGMKDSKVIAAGDSASDLELLALADKFLFAGSKSEFELVERLFYAQNVFSKEVVKIYEKNKEKLIVGGTGPKLFKKIVEELQRG